MFEVDVCQVVAGLVIIRMEAEAGDGLGHHTFFCQDVVVRAGKEVLIGVRIAGKARAM